MKATLAIPRDAVVRLHVQGGTPYPYMLALARPPMEATPTAIVSSGNVCASLTHDAGQAWLDHVGEELVGEVLAAGGGALVSFAAMGDALRCKKRMEAGRG